MFTATAQKSNTLVFPYTGITAYSISQQDVFSFRSNEAALARLKQAAAAVYGERRFLLEATSYYTAAVALPTSKGNFGIALDYGGFKNFNEQQSGLVYARSLGSKVDAGIRFSYHGYRIPLYGNSSTVSEAIGIILHFTENFHGGFHAENLFSAGLNGSVQEKLPSVYSAGFGYDASNVFFTGIEIIKEENKSVNVIIGMQYEFMKQFFARMGFASANSGLFAGAGLGFNIFRLDVSAVYHPQLGISPALMLIMEIGKKQENL